MPGNAGTCGEDPSALSYDVPPQDPVKRAQSGTIEIPAMVKTEREYRDDICQIGRLVFQKGWVAANDGNITIRLDAERILATPTGVCKGLMQPDDLIIVDMKGNKISGRAERTSEIAMHTTVYGLRPDIKAVVHAHPPVATGFATAGRQLNLGLLPEVIIGLGCVPLAAYGLPGTDALTEPMLPLIPKFDALMMANHGAVCYGEDVFKAYFKMETMEHFARIQLVAELLGGPKVLPRVEVDKLLDSRTRYGVKAKSAGEPNCPVAAEDVGSSSSCGVSAGLGNQPRSQEEHFYVSRSELVQMVEDALKARGIA
jgi:L-fuculose-phosphate aldolase